MEILVYFKQKFDMPGTSPYQCISSELVKILRQRIVKICMFTHDFMQSVDRA